MLSKTKLEKQAKIYKKFFRPDIALSKRLLSLTALYDMILRLWPTMFLKFRKFVKHFVPMWHVCEGTLDILYKMARYMEMKFIHY